jgi:glucosylceramidase
MRISLATHAYYTCLPSHPSAASVDARPAPRREHAAPAGVAVYQTSAGNADRLTRLADVPLSSSTAPADLTIDAATTYQSIFGFGGAITEAAVTVMASMPARAQEALIEAYYGESGLQYSVGRVHINSCDFSVKNWSFDDVVDDFALVHFDRNITHEGEYLLPFLHKALKASVHPLKLFATPWSPPAWMKSNNAMDHSNAPGLRPEAKYHQVWAEYISLWFTSFAQKGITLWGMTVQNESENDATWESNLYTPQQQEDFVADFLGPVMQKDHPDMKILGFDHNKVRRTRTPPARSSSPPSECLPDDSSVIHHLSRL